jgi:8-oxo-dGTP diphosphatase
MRAILTLREQDITPGSPLVETADFKHRRAARAVVLDEQGKVALLKVNRHNYHKLPGGGVEEGEDLATALERELLEEIGCSAEVSTEIGEIVEYRDRWSLKQTSYCYLAKQLGAQQAPSLTDEEAEEGFEPIWAHTIDEAISLLERDEPDNYDGQFIKRRDVVFLKAARQLVAE